MPTVFGILLILASVFLIVSVLLQGGKSNNRLSGAIAGGAETFFGKSKADSMEKKLSKVTAIVAVVFAVLVLVLYIIQDNVDYSDYSVPTESSGTTVDAGVHLISRFGESSGTEEDFSAVYAETGRAICGGLITSAVGFGAMIIADHPGLASLGKLTILGFALNLVVMLLAFPALLIMRRRGKAHF